MPLEPKQVQNIWSARGNRSDVARRRIYWRGLHTPAELMLRRLDGRAKSVVRTNWLRYAATFHGGFLASRPVTYTIGDQREAGALRALQRVYQANSLYAADRRHLTQAITYGYSVEIHAWDGERHVITPTYPWEWALVRDESGQVTHAIRRLVIEPWSLYQGELQDREREVYVLYDSEAVTTYERSRDSKEGLVITSSSPHFYGVPPIVVYQAQEEAESFFSDAFLVQCDVYDVTRSSLTDDIKHNVDSLLRTTGMRWEPLLERDAQGRTVLEKLREMGILPLPENASADYISRSVDVEKFRYDLRTTRGSIHLMASLPDLDDVINGSEGTITSISGIALKLMFQSCIQQSSEFSMHFANGLRQRVNLINTIDAIRGLPPLTQYDVRMTQEIPYNDIELVQYLTNMDGVVSTREKLRLLPFITDPERAYRELQDEQNQNASVGTVSTPEEGNATSTQE